MEQIKHLIDVFIHLDGYISNLNSSCGNWTYVIVFAIVFCETGLIIVPFLPGDSLLFVLGALAAANTLNMGLLWILLSVAAILGNMLNYFVGARMIHVIKRANQILLDLEKSDPPPRHEESTLEKQVAQLATLNLATLSPLEAFKFLLEWQEHVKKN